MHLQRVSTMSACEQSAQAEMSRNFLASCNLYQPVPTFLGKSTGRAGHRTSDLLFSSPYFNGKDALFFSHASDAPFSKAFVKNPQFHNILYCLLRIFTPKKYDPSEISIIRITAMVSPL